eukprot:tig00000145_g8857.t1
MTGAVVRDGLRRGAGEFLILASDGCFERVSSAEAVQVVSRYLPRDREPAHASRPAAAGQAILRLCLSRIAAELGITVEELVQLPPGHVRRSVHDDITVAVVLLDRLAGVPPAPARSISLPAPVPVPAPIPHAASVPPGRHAVPSPAATTSSSGPLKTFRRWLGLEPRPGRPAPGTMPAPAPGPRPAPPLQTATSAPRDSLEIASRPQPAGPSLSSAGSAGAPRDSLDLERDPAPAPAPGPLPVPTPTRR